MERMTMLKIMTETQAGMVTLSVLVLLAASLIGGKAVSVFKIPKVAGEIIGGMVVGPSILGNLSPEVFNYIFLNFPAQGEAISVFYWLGLIFLMFSSGYDSNMEDFGEDKKIIFWLVIGATVFPLITGYYVSDRYFADFYLGEARNRFVFNIIFAIATAVTSMPVISKIFMDLGLINHRFAKIILSSAAVQDLFLWVILSVAGSMVMTSDAPISISSLVTHVALTMVMIGFAVIAAPKLRKLNILRLDKSFNYESIYFLTCFLCVYLGTVFRINIMYSAFAAGIIFKNLNEAETLKTQAKLRDICMSFFTPVYFAIVGLRIHVTAEFSVSYFLAFLAIASLIELSGCILTMRLLKVSWMASFNFGVAMNARGGPGIVLAAVTYDMGIINYEFFCVLIFTSLITSSLAGYWIDGVNKKGKLVVR
jgi:Kef-type K+ transport system membrane component KefB